MNIAKLKDLAEIIALVAVVGSLIAVVLELQQTQGALQAQAYQTRALDGISTNFEIAKDEGLARLSDLIYSPDFDADSLSAEERRIVTHLLIITRIDLDNEHYQYQMGFLDQGFYKGETEPWIRRIAPIWRAFGQVEPRADFRREVDRILEE